MLANIAHAEMRVAVIDTGYNGKRAKICSQGNYDFIHDLPIVGKDKVGHGTAVINTIAQGNKNYCVLVYKVFDTGHADTLKNIINAVNMAVENHADVINLSIEGSDFYGPEMVALMNASVFHHVKLFIASGNDGRNLDVTCNVYPACYRVPGATVVGTLDSGTVGNYGRIVTQQEHWCSEGKCGTSLSTAIATQKYVKGKYGLN